MKTTTDFQLVSTEKLIPYGKISHSEGALRWIEKQMHQLGVNSFRFCKENDCYICDERGNFFSICKRQYSKSGNFIEKYRIQKLTGSTDKYGYRTYRIAVDGEKKHLKAHRMMMNAWVGENSELVVFGKMERVQKGAKSCAGG